MVGTGGCASDRDGRQHGAAGRWRAAWCARDGAEPLHRHLLPTDELVMGDLRSDGIHPSNAAYDRIATGVYELMKKEGMRR